MAVKPRRARGCDALCDGASAEAAPTGAMNHIVITWLQFVACCAVIGVAGYHLARYGDALSQLTGLSGNWIGLALVATVTSVPELVTGLSAVTFADAPDIAVGDAIGACVLNLFFLAVIDVLHRDGSLYERAAPSHLLSASFVVVLMAVAGLAILLAQYEGLPALGHVSPASIAMLVLYAVAMRTIFRFERARGPALEQERESPPAPMTLRHALLGYSGAGLVVIGAGIWLPFIGVELAHAMGWSNTFVGTLFVALATTMPEAATTLAAIRMGAVDLALGNLLGSGLFNLLIVALDDFAYLPGPIFDHISTLHAMSALTAILMTGAVIVALVYRPSTRVLRTISWAGLALTALFVLNSWLLYRHGQ